ncbi:SapC family protein [uncultured Psychrosphaera sp.]|uniref:SapC family protein n=1 Tax=uncultured Psychrosphaera sp. TaxID=1403522 RepID=UPI00261D2099|nr:SapC family protein [uncultured Psychrosphaera sp.]
MADNFQPLHKETHKNIKIKPATSVEDLATQHALGVVVQEFALAGNQYPIAFVQGKDQEGYFPVALLGLEPNKNLFVNADNKWEGMYMPARYTHKPFSVIPSKEDANLFGIAINIDSAVVSEGEGEALFTETGEETEYLAKRKKSLISYVEHEQITKGFIDELVKLDLLHPQNINVKVSEKEFNLNGLFIVDEKKLSALSDEDFLGLRKRGFLGPIYAHLGSMHQVNNLIQKQVARDKA